MSNRRITTIFIGTPDFGIPSLEALAKAGDIDLAGVITQPDKPVGRKQILSAPPIKIAAEKHNIPVHQPERIKDFEFPANNIDLIIVAAYAQILPKAVLEYPKYGCLNVHASLLPRYRGASPIQQAILNGDKETGVTIMKMDEGLDTGPTLAMQSIAIAANDTAGALFNKLAQLGAALLLPTARKYINGEIEPIPQDGGKASLTKQLRKSAGHIDWAKAAEEIERHVRAMSPWPGAWGKCQMSNDELRMVKIISTDNNVLDIDKYSLGELFIYNGKLAIQCGKGALLIKKLQLEGKNEITGEEFIHGYSKMIGQVLK